MKDGTLDPTGSRPLIRFERTLRQPPAVVWRALTEAAELTGWFPCAIETERWQVGAELVFRFPGPAGPTMAGTVLACDPPHLLCYTWGEETLRYQLSPDPAGGTRLVFTDELDPGIAARNAAGWDLCLDLLAGTTNGETPWQRRFEHYVGVFEPVLGHQDGPPLGFADAAQQ